MTDLRPTTFPGKAKLTALGLVAAVLASCSQSVPLVVSSKPVLIRGVGHSEIIARTYWNETGITLRAGHRYRLGITGNWNDSISKCTAKGPVCPLVNALMFPLRPTLRFPPRRDGGANFFVPVATIGRGQGKELPEHAFIIRDGMTYSAPATGILHVFANDSPWAFAYSNNSGSLQLTVEEHP